MPISDDQITIMLLNEEIADLRRKLYSRLHEVPMQTMIDAGINGFAVELLAESLVKFKDWKTTKPLTFAYRDVVFTVRPNEEAS